MKLQRWRLRRASWLSYFSFMSPHRKGHKNRKRLSKTRNPRNKGALHRQLHISQDEKIGRKRLRKVVNTSVGQKVFGVTVTPLIKQRANWALNINKGK
jgi:hypothetical protein